MIEPTKEERAPQVQAEVQTVNAIFQGAFPGIQLATRFRNGTLIMFLSRLSLDEVIEAMEIAVRRDLDKDNTIKYFCGICWNKLYASDTEPANADH